MRRLKRTHTRAYMLMKNDLLKDWGKYKEWVNEQNKPMMEFWLKDQKEQFKREKQYLENEKRERTRLKNKYEKEKKDYDELPFYKKWATEEPDKPWKLSFLARRHIYPMNLWMPHLKQATWEGYLDWLNDKQQQKTSSKKEAGISSEA